MESGGDTFHRVRRVWAVSMPYVSVYSTKLGHTQREGCRVAQRASGQHRPVRMRRGGT